MTFERASELVGRRVLVRQGYRLFAGVLQRVDAPRRHGRSSKMCCRVIVVLRNRRGVDDSAIFELAQLIDLKEEK
jgi:hypothetical protein